MFNRDQQADAHNCWDFTYRQIGEVTLTFLHGLPATAGKTLCRGFASMDSIEVHAWVFKAGWI